MKYINTLLFFLFITVLASCSPSTIVKKTSELPDVELNKLDIPEYRDAIDRLSAKIMTSCEKLDLTQTFYIYNADAIDQDHETVLSWKCINDLKFSLINKGLRIKRKELASFGRATQRSSKVECKEVLQSIAPDYLIGFSLMECPESKDCAEARVQVSKEKSNDIECIASEAFQLQKNVVTWKKQYRKIDYAKGLRKNPYIDLQEAARQMIGKISCIAQNIMPEYDLHVIVKNTKGTPQSITDFFISALTEYGIKNVPMTGKWLDVILNAQDQFEMRIYEKEHKEKLSIANVVLGVHLDKSNQKLMYVRARLLTLKTIILKQKNKNVQTIKAGLAIPDCLADGYLIPFKLPNTIRAIGLGECNKKFGRKLWKESALEAARINSRANLVKQVEAYIEENAYVDKNILDNVKRKSIIKAIIRKVRFLNEKFDEANCIAKITAETEDKNILSLLPSLGGQNLDIEAAFKEELHYQDFQNPAIETGNTAFYANPDEAYSESQKIMLENILSPIKQRLKDNKIKPEVTNYISISGNIGLPDCQKEKNYQASSLSVPLRHFCTLNYNIKLILKHKEVMFTEGCVEGSGSNQDAAWDDALKGIQESIYPLIYEIALIINDKYTMDKTYRILENIENQLWQIAADLSIEDIVDDLETIQKEIDGF